MDTEFLTKSDFDQLKKDFISEIIEFLKPTGKLKKQSIKSKEVTKILGCSRSTVNVLRNKNLLKATMIGYNWYFDVDEVENLRKNGISYQ